MKKIKCLACSKTFKVGKYPFNESSKKICLECRQKLSKFSGRDRNREIVRMKSNHTCGKCKKKWNEGDRRFDIHHLNGLCGKKSRGYDSIKDIDKLVCLCHHCHLNLDEVVKKMSVAYWKKNK